MKEEKVGVVRKTYAWTGREASKRLTYANLKVEARCSACQIKAIATNCN